MELLRLVKELRGKEEFNKQMYLAQRKLDMYRQEKTQMESNTIYSTLSDNRILF